MTRAAPQQVLIRTPKTAELVADHIRGLILKGELGEGDYLQPEHQLLESLHVSRPTLREAFRVLETENFIVVVRGSRRGARVRLPKSDRLARYAGFVLQGEKTYLREVYDAKELIEPTLVYALAQDHRPDQIIALRQAIQAGYAAFDAGDRKALAVNASLIHKAIVDQYGNRPLALTVSLLQHIVERHQANVGAADADADAAWRKRVAAGLKSMSKLVDLVEAGDAVGAAKHWRLHLGNAKARWLEGHAETLLIDVMD